MMRLSSSVFLFVFLLVFQNGIAINTNHCPSSACGRTNVSYPFRLPTDPVSCGDDQYKLSCENNVTFLHLFNGGKYYVKAINYDKFTIQMVDAGIDKDDCASLPSFPLTTYSFGPEDPYTSYKYKQKMLYHSRMELLPIEMISFINCKNPVNSSVYLDTNPYIYRLNSSTNSSLSHSGMYSYAYVGELKGYDLRDGCSLEMVSLMLPRRDFTNKNSSFVEIHRQMAFGFELSWHTIYCRRCPSGICYLDTKDHFHCLGSGTSFAVILKDIQWILLTYIMPSLCMLLIARVLCGAPCVTAFLIYKWRKRHLSGYNTIEEFLQAQNNLMPIRYAYLDIKKMTGGFKEILGKGGFGSVYKGELRSGQFVAVKMLEKSKTNGQDFINEIATIGRIHHANVVRLIGFCSEGPKNALIYEFMSNGSLDSHIFSRELSLSWVKLYEISLGIARGIEYLHRGCDIQILHFDIKPHNILLNENFTPKVSDFGLAKLYPTKGSITSLTAARGTIGYMAPELFYKNIGRVSYKADVYSFGMLLLEMAGKRRNLKAPTDDELEENLSQIYYPFWVHDKLTDGKLEIRDATDEDNKIVTKMIMTGLWCIQMQPSTRPAMNEVVEMLEGDLEGLQLSPRPLIYPEASMQKDGEEQSSVEVSDSSSLIHNHVDF